MHTSSIAQWPSSQPSGWIVTTVTDVDGKHDLFRYLLHWDATHGQYRALLISPRLEVHIGREASAHDLHLYPDGTMCVTPDIGAPDLETTYARSVLWCNGVATIIRRGEPFPFNVGQEPL